ncbi:MAG: hypothetical protein IJO79_05640 [Firmicutes bacterium]|nr:hypothetical protein [Bacillota bacterium]
MKRGFAMIQKKIFKGTCRFPGLEDYTMESTVVLNILDLEASGKISTEFTEEIFGNGLPGLSQRKGSKTWKLTGCLQDSCALLDLRTGEEVPPSEGKINLILRLSSDENSLCGEYYKNGMGPAELHLQKI